MLTPTPAPVDVWTVSLDEVRTPVLSTDERERAAKFRFERDRLHWIHARSALRCILGRYLNVDSHKLAFLYGPNGKPTLQAAAPIHFNLSHSENYAMVAVTRGAPVGIDLERIRDDRDITKLLRRIGEITTSQSTRELFQIWTRREAKTKALGIPLMQIPAGHLCVTDLSAPPQFAAALALLGCEPQVAYRDF